MASSPIFREGPQGTVSFGQKLASSDAFKVIFREGMTLVEESAAYLDGPGRQDARELQRTDALTYASESMRLTTRLMQLASWLLLQRAVNEGEMTQTQAATDKHRVKLSRQDIVAGSDAFLRLPERLRELSTQSVRLQARIMHLDQLIYGARESAPPATAAPGIASQMQMLQRAFAPGAI